MRVALYIYFHRFPTCTLVIEDDVEGLSTEIQDYQLEDYQCHCPLQDMKLVLEEVEPGNSSKTLEQVEGDQGGSSLNSSTDAPPSSSSIEHEEKCNFTCGNPDAQTIHGIMHFYNDITKCGDGYKSDLVCLLSVPTLFNLLDILSLIAPYRININGIRIIRDRNPNTFMVLIRFLDAERAEEFYLNQQGQPFNSLEESICHLAFVSSLEFGKTEVHMKSLAAGPLIELPQCAVCLERMDESTTGMLTVLCNHTFHCECMSKCTTCPVCRFHAVPPEQSSHSCMLCGNTEGLWLCLICGYVGCGRYEGGHAYGHFERTNHTYSMEVEERCVWDYIGDNYVHRLIQNKADGKIVAVQDQDGMIEEKFESLTLEYTYLLTQQLESQREFFEKKLVFVEEEAMERIVSVEGEVQKVAEDKEKYKAKSEECEKERTKLEKKGEEERRRLEKKLDNLTNKLNEISRELNDERELNKSLQANQKEWIAKVVSSNDKFLSLQQQHSTETQELREQVKDLMFHLQSQATISNSSMKEEIQSGEVHMVPGPSTENTKPSRRSPRKKK